MKGDKMMYKYSLPKMITLLVTILVANLLACSNARFGSNGSGDKNRVDNNKSDSQITDGANQIQFNDNGLVTTWSRDTNNISVYSSYNCVKGLATNADDANVKAKAAELFQLINTSTVAHGALSMPSNGSVYLTIRYDNGNSRKFNLRNDLAATNEETLSKGTQIIDFFDRVNYDIQYYGVVSCNNGKK
jgi:hypothetical protein